MQSTFYDFDHGITCVDTLYQHRGHTACYLLIENNHAAFVDTGTGKSVPYLLKILKLKNISIENVDYVIPTHVHLDHAGGAGKLMHELPNAKLVIHPRGAKHMVDPNNLIIGVTTVYGQEKFKEYFGEVVPIDKERVIVAEDNSEINFAGRLLTFLDTPGHARHHFCVYDKLSESVFTGDTFGLSYRELKNNNADFILPTTTPVQFEPEPWYDSIDKILALKPKNIYLTHFGRITDVENLARQLKQDIAKYAEITKQYLHQNDSENKIRKDIEIYLQERLQAVYTEEKVKKFMELLESDLNLNAAGLKVWLTRLEKTS